MTQLKKGSPLPAEVLDAEVLYKTGSPTTLNQLLDHRGTLVTFIRHFGCIGCSAHMAELAPRMRELSELGINQIIVGNGNPQFIEGFIERYRLDESLVSIVTDPSLRIHRLAQLKRSFLSAFGPRAIIQMIKTRLKGHIQNSIEGDNLQQGGTLFLNEQRQLVFFHQDENLGDFAKTTSLIDSVYGTFVHKNALYR